MNWFRFDHDAIDDRKVMTLEPRVFMFWIKALCVASKQRERGTLPGLEDLAYATRESLDQTKALVQVLVAARLVDCDSATGAMRMHNWSLHQRQSDDAAARMRRARERHKGKRASHARERDKPARQPRPASPPASPPVATAPEAETWRHYTGCPDALGRVETLFGSAARDALASDAATIHRAIGGRWDLLEAAADAAHRSRAKPGQRPIEDLQRYLIRTVQRYASEGLPAKPVRVESAEPPSRAQRAQALRDRLGESATQEKEV